MSEQELPPWLREQLARLQQLQQNLQAIMMQKQQVELEVSETERALEELKKTTADDTVYKLFSVETVTWAPKSGVDCISPFRATNMEFNC